MVTSRIIRFNFLIAVLLSTFSVLAQTPKGAEVENTTKTEVTTGKTYALIIGISKYKNPAIPQLQYADKDANAFRNYLVATGVDSNNITLLVNEQATHSEILLSLYEICVDKTKPGDKVFIYFSGHGDVESKVITNAGYLLTYDAPTQTYAISALDIRLLQDYVSTLSSKGVLPIVIVDACHAGNLAGGPEGMKNIQIVLKDKWTSEVKMLSCEPGQVSLEGKQWGGGRGLFSYELLNGMAGMADKNKDGQVTLRELNIYLMDRIADEAEPSLQNPMILGEMSETICKVNEKIQPTLLSQPSSTALSAIDLKGFDELLLKGLNDTIRENYRLFKLYLDSGIILRFPYSLGNLADLRLDNLKLQPSAYYYYINIAENANTKILLGLMKRNLCAGIMSEASDLLELIMNNQNREIHPDDFLFMPTEIQILHQILGDKKLQAIGFQPKAFFFRAVPLLFFHDSIRANKAIPIIDSGLAIDSLAAYLYEQRGIASNILRNYTTASTCAWRALSLSPKFAPPYDVLVTAYEGLGKYDSAIILSKIGMGLKPSQTIEFNETIGTLFYKKNLLDSGANYFNRAVEMASDKKDSTGIWAAHFFWGKVYFELADYKNALNHYLIARQTMPSFLITDYKISCCYAQLGDIKNSIKFLNLVLKNKTLDFAEIKNQSALDNLRQEAEFKSLMKKYFPDQYKE